MGRRSGFASVESLTSKLLFGPCGPSGNAGTCRLNASLTRSLAPLHDIFCSFTFIISNTWKFLPNDKYRVLCTLLKIKAFYCKSSSKISGQIKTWWKVLPCCGFTSHVKRLYQPLAWPNYGAWASAPFSMISGSYSLPNWITESHRKCYICINTTFGFSNLWTLHLQHY